MGEKEIETIPSGSESSAFAELLSGLAFGSDPADALISDRVYVGVKEYSVPRSGKKYADKTVSVTDKINEFYNWTPAQYNDFISKLRKNNYLSKNESIDPGQASVLWNTFVSEAAKYYSATGGKKKLTVDNIITLYARDRVETEELPTQTITQYAPEYLDKLVDGIFLQYVGRTATDEEKKAKLKELNDMIAKGTTTTTKRVGGKNVVTSTPGFSGELAEIKISEELKTDTSTSAEYERRKAFEFSNALNKIMSGGM